MPRQQLDNFTRAYIEAALWSTNDESDDRGGEPLDANYSASDIAPETMELIKEDCADFQEKYAELLSASGLDNGKAGYNFWLSRNGHGAGFFDDDLDELQDAAESYGGFDIYVGDDGLIYGPPPDWYRGRHARRAPGGVSEALPRPHRVHGRYRKPEPPRGHLVLPRGTVRDFDTRDELIAHAQGEGATHVVVVGSGATLYFPFQTAGGRVVQYEEARAWRQNGYWHVPAPGSRKTVDRLPPNAQPIADYLRGSGQRAAEAPRGRSHRVRDYVPVDHRGRPLSGPTKDYSAAKRQADQAGGFVKFTSVPPPGGVSEAFGRKTRWSDWEILDAVDRGQPVTPEAERRAVKLAQLGFIDTTGTWRLTTKGRQVVDRRVPVAAEAPAHRVASRVVRRRPSKVTMTEKAVKGLADDLAVENAGNPSKILPGGFRWSEPNVSAVFTTSSPEYQQKVVVVVSVFGDGSTALNFFSDEGLSGTATYENISHFTYGEGAFDQMVADIKWVRKTVDDYAASWQQDETEVDESLRPSPRRRTHTPKRRRRAGRR